MKRAFILTGIGILCFVASTIGIYVAMPSLSPERVDDTRARLDSLGLIVNTQPDAATSVRPDTLLPNSADTTDAIASTDSTDSTTVTDALPTPQEIIQTLKDSIYVSNNLIQNLKADTSALSTRMHQLLAQIDVLTTKDFEATELSQSLIKLDAKQLGNILAGLELDIIELLYQKASARDRTRLLESMSPDQAARFVRTLVKGPQPEATLDTEEPDTDPTNAAGEAPSNL